MTQWTDVCFTITATGAHFITAEEIHVTLSQLGRIIDLTGGDVETLDDEHLQAHLSQAQSGAFRQGSPLSLQVNFIDGNGERKASGIAEISCLENLLKRVIGNE